MSAIALQARLLHQISTIGNGAEMYVDRATLEARLAEVQAQNGRLQDIADNAMEMLQDPSSHSPRDTSRVATYRDHIQASINALMRPDAAAGQQQSTLRASSELQHTFKSITLRLSAFLTADCFNSYLQIYFELQHRVSLCILSTLCCPGLELLISCPAV